MLIISKVMFGSPGSKNLAMRSLSVCNFYHTVPYHGVAVSVAFLEFLNDDIFSRLLVFHMHHRVVEIGIEFLADRLDGLDADRTSSVVISCL